MFRMKVTDLNEICIWTCHTITIFLTRSIKFDCRCSTEEDMSVKRIVFMDIIHRPVSQDQKNLKKTKNIDKRFKPEQIKNQTSTNKSHRDQLQTTE
jgi:hypothetical protein